jgi:hypothetical protein
MLTEMAAHANAQEKKKIENFEFLDISQPPNLYVLR